MTPLHILLAIEATSAVGLAWLIWGSFAAVRRFDELETDDITFREPFQNSAARLPDAGDAARPLFASFHDSGDTRA